VQANIGHQYITRLDADPELDRRKSSQALTGVVSSLPKTHHSHVQSSDLIDHPDGENDLRAIARKTNRSHKIAPVSSKD